MRGGLFAHHCVSSVFLTKKDGGQRGSL